MSTHHFATLPTHNARTTTPYPSKRRFTIHSAHSLHGRPRGEILYEFFRQSHNTKPPKTPTFSPIFRPALRPSSHPAAPIITRITFPLRSSPTIAAYAAAS